MPSPKPKPTRPKTQPAAITQAELAAVLNTYNGLAMTATEIRRRMDAGAEIESGPLKAEDSDTTRPIVFGPTKVLDIYHLDITPADFVAPEAVKNAPPTRQDQRDQQTALTAFRLEIAGLDDSERAFLATCQQIYREDRGCTTPFNEFLWGLVRSVEHGDWPTPDDVRHELETFETNWNDVKQTTTLFAERYPAPKEGN